MSMDINPYSLTEILIAKTVAAATSYQTPVDLSKDQMFTVTPVLDTDLQRDSGKVTSSLAIETHAELEINAGGIPFEALVPMLGATSSTSGAEVTVEIPAGSNRPYFGAIGVAPTDDGRYVACGLYKCQITGGPAVNFDGITNAWITSEMSGICMVKESVGEWRKFKIYDTLSDWKSAKPTDGAEFLAWFS
jgi:hypothetical protein